MHNAVKFTKRNSGANDNLPDSKLVLVKIGRIMSELRLRLFINSLSTTLKLHATSPVLD